jgi:hypothetical protein
MTDQTRYPPQRGSNTQRTSPGTDGRFSRRGEDPLAELARLIGQDDPFADYSADQSTAARTPQSQSQPRPGNGNGAASRDPRHAVQEHFKRDYTQQAEEAEAYDPPPPQRPAAPRADGRGAAYSYGSPPAERIDREAPQTSRTAPRSQAYQQEEYLEDPQYAQAQAEPADPYDYEDQRYADGADEQGQHAQYYEEGPYDQGQAAEYETEYAEDDYQQEYADEAYDDAPRRSRSRVMLIVMSLIAVAVLGVASLYGYRAVFGKHHTGTPPTIRSGDAPNKVVPSTAQASTDAVGQKQIYDRVGGGNEKVVSREEQPADLNAARPSEHVVNPPAMGPRPGGSVSAFTAPAAEANRAPVLNPPSSSSGINRAAGEPRRVHTVTVRSDGTIVPDSRHTVSTRAVSAPLALNPNAHTEAREEAGREPPQAEPERAAAPVRNVVPVQNNNSPWSGVRQPAPAARPQQVTNYVPANSYVVQVSSQKSEADAQASWQQLQSKYASVLGNQQVSFKRVDLGDRGTFYRAMVGPFSGRDQAYEMCQNLKAAGGECVVQRN